jgi:hypothetical protein
MLPCAALLANVAMHARELRPNKHELSGCGGACRPDKALPEVRTRRARKAMRLKWKMCDGLCSKNSQRFNPHPRCRGFSGGVVERRGGQSSAHQRGDRVAHRSNRVSVMVDPRGTGCATPHIVPARLSIVVVRN